MATGGENELANVFVSDVDGFLAVEAFLYDEVVGLFLFSVLFLLFSYERHELA